MNHLIDNLELRTLTKMHLTQVLADEVGFSFREARKVVDGFFDILVEQLSTGDGVKLTNFGNFNVHVKKARPGRNPRSGEPVEIGARQSVRFQAGRKLLQQIQDGVTSDDADDEREEFPSYLTFDSHLHQYFADNK